MRLARWNHCEIFFNVSQWWLCFLTGYFCETRSVKSLWDFLKCLTVIDMNSHGGLLWDSIGEITVRFSGKSFWRLMISHVCLLWVSHGDVISRFFLKVSCDTYGFSRTSFVRLAVLNIFENFCKVFCDTYAFSCMSSVSLAPWNHYAIFKSFVVDMISRDRLLLVSLEDVTFIFLKVACDTYYFQLAIHVYNTLAQKKKNKYHWKISPNFTKKV